MCNQKFPRLLGLLLVAAAGSTVLSGCSPQNAPNTVATREPSSTTSTAAIGDGYLCNGLPVSHEALRARVPVAEINEAGRIALSSAVSDNGQRLDFPPDEGWYVATQSEDFIGVMRDVGVTASPDEPMIIAPDREVVGVDRTDDAAALEPEWYAYQSGPCALTIDLGELSVPAIRYQSPPDPLAEELHLLVTEQECNSGQDAEGRVKVVSLIETDVHVTLVLGVQPRTAGQDCPGNPSTPFTVALSAPLGEREVVDGGLADPRPLPLSD